MVLGLCTISDDKLIVKNILNIDIDMEVVKVNDAYKVKVKKLII